MESLAGYLKLAGGWRWLLLIVPLVGAIVACALVASQPVVYVSKAVVKVDPPANTSVTQATSAFVGDVGSRTVARAVADQVGVSVDQVSGELSALPQSASGSPTGLVVVTYEGPSRDEAEAILSAAVIEAQKEFYAAPLLAAQAAVTQAEADYAAASEAAAAAGLTDLLAELKSQEGRLASLLARPDQAAVAGAVEQAQAAVAATRAQLEPLTVQRESLDSAEAILLTARRTLSSTQAQLQAATDPAATTVSAVQPANRMVDVARAAVTGALFGMLVSGLIVAVVVVVRTRPETVAADTGWTDAPSVIPTPARRDRA